MVSIIFIILAYFCLIISKKLFRSYFSPLGIYGALWAVLLALFYLRIVPYPSLSPIGNFVIFGSYGSFLCGSLTYGLAKNLKINQPNLSKQAKSDNVIRLSARAKRFLRISIAIIGILAVIGSIISFIKVAGFVGWEEVFSKPWLMKYAPRGEFELGRIWGFMDSLNYVIAVLGGFYLGAISRRFLFAYSGLLGITIHGLTWGGRAAILEVILLYATAYFLGKMCTQQNFRRWITWRKVILLGVAGVIIFSLFTFVVTTRGGFSETPSYISQYSAFNLPPAIFQYYYYFTANLPALDIFLSNYENYFFLGQKTFYPVTKQFYKFGLIDKLPQVRNFENVNTPIPINTFTYLRPIYEDFGPVGILILPYFLGLISSYLFASFIQRPTILKLVILPYLYVYLFFSFIANELVSLSLWFSLIFVILVILFLKRRKSVLKPLNFNEA